MVVFWVRKEFKEIIFFDVKKSLNFNIFLK